MMNIDQFESRIIEHIVGFCQLWKTTNLTDPTAVMPEKAEEWMTLFQDHLKEP